MKRVIVEITRESLERNGFDGLYNHNKRCSCSINNLQCCAEYINECVVAQKTECDCTEGCEFHLKPAEDEQDAKIH